MRALVSAIWICAGAPVALAQSYSASGQVGYLQEAASRMSKPPDDRAQRANPQNGGSGGLNCETRSAFCGGF
jgi:hypothetical protein